MLNKTIKINEKEYTLRNSMRVEMIFEYIKGAPFDIKDANDWRLYFYCMIKANNDYDKPYYSEDGTESFLDEVSNEDFASFINIMTEYFSGEYARLKEDDKKKVEKKRTSKQVKS